MSLVERLEAAAKEKGSNFKRIEQECGLGNGTIKRWEKQSPRLDKLMKVSEYLQLSLDYIVYGKKENRRSETKCDGVPLTESEADLIAMYRLVPDADKQTIFDIAKLKYEQSTGEKVSIYSTYSDVKERQKSGSDRDDKPASGTA
jgi:transcriptional regulator with XRE-family HTH domain